MPTTDEDALRAIRAASKALQKRWLEGESPRSWAGVTWMIGDRIEVLNLEYSGVEVLAPQIGQLTALIRLDLQGSKQLKELPPQIGQLLDLTYLGVGGCDQLTLAPGAEEGQPVQTIVAAYARLLIVEPRKDAPGELLSFLRANPLWVPAFFKYIIGDLTGYGEAITAWLGEAIKATPELANLTAPDGRSVTDVAGLAQLSRATAKPDEDTLRAIRAASTALQKKWPEGESPRSWGGITWSGDRVQELNFVQSELEVLSPQIGQLTALTKLCLRFCKQLKELPPQIGQLTALTNLAVSCCDQLKELPPQIGQLTALTDLVVSGCDQLKELPPQIGQLTALTDLNLNSCGQLKELPPQIGQLTALTKLELCFCKQLKELPPQIGQLPALAKLDLHMCEQLTLAPGAEEQGQPVQTIVAAYARLLIVEPRKDAPGELLSFLRANPLTVQPFFKHIVSDLTVSEAITAWLGEAIKATPELANLTAPDGRSVTDVAGLAQLSRATAKPDEDALRAIRAASTALQKKWPRGGSPRSWYDVKWKDDRVQELYFGYSQLEVLSPQIGQLTALTKFSLHSCDQLKELPPQIGQLTALTNLDVSGCDQLKELPPQIGQLTALTVFDLRGCDQLTLAPGAEEGQAVRTIVAAYARLLIVEPRKDAPGELLSFLRANPLAVPPFFGTILTNDTHATWLGQAVTDTPDLAKFTDASGRRAVDVAHKTCRQKMLESSWLCKRYELQPGPPEHRSATSVVIRADDHLADKLKHYGQIFVDADKNGNGTLDGAELDAAAKILGLNKDLVQSEAAKQGSATSTDGTVSTRLSKEAFVSACRRLLGDGPQKVVIKLMKDEVQWKREMTSRSWKWDPATNKYIPSQNEEPLDARFVVQALDDAPTQTEMANAVSNSRFLQDMAGKYMENTSSINEYAYPVVMDAANRNLSQIFLQERPGPDALCDLARQIFDAVHHLHSRKLMHGDLKTLNLVRSIMDGKLRLIDFDAFASIIEGGEAGESYACAKFSSGVLPPEALYELQGEEHSQFDKYWADLKDKHKDTELWSKVKPMEGNGGQHYVVKTFRTGGDGKPIKDNLPYKLLPASSSLDMWSVGVMLYLLLTGENLVPVTRDDDFVSGAGMGYIFNWDDDKRRAKLSKISDPAAHDLVSQLLSPHPHTRSENSLAQLLDTHPFFNSKPGDTEMQKRLNSIQEGVNKIREEQYKQTALLRIIKDLSTENKTELRHTREALMKGIFEATEVHTPTTFIVLDKELPALPSTKEKDELLQIAKDGSGVTLNAKFGTLTFSEEGASVKAAGKCKEYVDHLNTGMKWVNRLKDIGSSLAAGKVDDAFETIKKGLGDLVTGKTMYLYLVDELTGEPVRADGYPIKITEPSKIVPKLLPVMQVGLRAMSIFNGAAGIARMVGYPVPTVPAALSTGVRESVNILKKKSSVEDFDVVQKVIDKDGPEKESDSLRGHSLRVFTDFLNANDPGLKAKQSGHFAGLQRVPDPNSGTALWTTLTGSEEIKIKLEQRALDRKAEEKTEAKDEKAAEPDAACTGTEVAGTKDQQQSAESSATRKVAVKELDNVAGTRDQQYQQITSQLSQIQHDMGIMSKLNQIQNDLDQLKSNDFKCTCIIG